MSQALNNFASIKLVTGYVNAENVPSPGLPAASPSGSIFQPYSGFVGTTFHMTTAEALAASLIATGTCLEGDYMYVGTNSAASGTIIRGSIVYWFNQGAGIVTPDVSATTVSQIAGVALCSITNGNYGVIQIAGICQVKFKASTTKTTPAIGDFVIADITPSNVADVLADATTLTSPTMKAALGVAVTSAPVGGAISPVSLRFINNR